MSSEVETRYQCCTAIRIIRRLPFPRCYRWLQSISVTTGGGQMEAIPPTVNRLDPEICVNPMRNMPEEIWGRGCDGCLPDQASTVLYITWALFTRSSALQS